MEFYNDYDFSPTITVKATRIEDSFDDIDDILKKRIDVSLLIAKFIHRYPVFEEMKRDLGISLVENSSIVLRMREIINNQDFDLYDDFYPNLFIVVLFSLSRIYKSLDFFLKIESGGSYSVSFKFRNGKIHSVKEHIEDLEGNLLDEVTEEVYDGYKFWTLTKEECFYMREVDE